MDSKQICGFSEAWVGTCKNAKPCQKHSGLKCRSCGNPATRSCDETGQFVCGAPLCDECEHTTAEDGTNGGIGFCRSSPLPDGYRDHCRRDKQQFTPWYARDRSTPKTQKDQSNECC